MTVMFLLTILLWIILAAVATYVLVWAINYVGLEPPWDKVARVVVVLIVLFLAIEIISSMAGHAVIPWR